MSLVSLRDCMTLNGLRHLRPVFCLPLVLAAVLGSRPASAEAPFPAPPSPGTEIRLALLSQRPPAPADSADPDPVPEDVGLAGARLALADNNTTGRFLGQKFILVPTPLDEEADPVAAFRALPADLRLVVLDLPGAAVAQIARLPEAQGRVLLNATAPDDSLRAGDCAANLFHTAPSRAMLADALAQYLLRKRWNKWQLIVGQAGADDAFASALRRAAKRFGGEIVEEKRWTAQSDLNRTAEAEIPTFTQGKRHDIVLIADEADAFGDYVPYRTWEPRPVAGTQGLVPTIWHRAHEQWGAAQLQSRFRTLAGRGMTAHDHAVWVAVRAIGEAATQARAGSVEAILAMLRDERFSMSAFRGTPMSFRPWDGQLRQPILLASDRSVVSVSPQEGFLHPVSELDTLGDDRAESRCRR